MATATAMPPPASDVLPIPTLKRQGHSRPGQRPSLPDLEQWQTVSTHEKKHVQQQQQPRVTSADLVVELDMNEIKAMAAKRGCAPIELANTLLLKEQRMMRLWPTYAEDWLQGKHTVPGVRVRRKDDVTQIGTKSN
jgi:hypothetical protein